MMFKKIISIRQKFTLAMIYILIFELIVFAVFVFFGGTLGTIVNSVYSDLSSTAQIRTANTEESLNLVSESANNSYNDINSIMFNAAVKGSSYYDAAFKEIIPKLQDVSADDNITGSYVIMGTDLTNPRLPALYMRKSNRNLHNQSYNLNVSSEAIVTDTGILRAQNWTNSLNVSENNGIDFLSEPIRLSAENTSADALTLGYWSMPYQINFDGENVISYSLPLRDKHNNCFGVFGVEVSLDRLRDILPYLEINNRGMGNYVLLCRDGAGSEEYSKVVVSGTTFEDLNSYSPTVVFKNNKIKNSLYMIDTPKKQKSKVYAAMNELNLWANSSYSHKTWVLCGVVDSTQLDYLENNIRIHVLVTFAFTMLFGLVFAWVMSRIIAEPLHKFLDEIKMIRADNPVIPSKSGVREINDIAEIVENLTDDLTDFSSKVSTIIDLAGIKVGAFEYDKDSDFVFCTDVIYNILNMEKSGDKLFMTRWLFEEKMSLICTDIVPDINRVHKVKTADGKVRFLQLKTALNNGKTLGIIQDITQETINEHAMKMAQDHDPMTNLLNRTAFRRTLNEKFSANTNIVAVLVHLNIDKMADINMRYGNSTGDMCIYSIGSVLKAYSGKITSFAARTAGDEFKIILMGYNRPDVEKRLAELINSVYAINITVPEGSIPMEISIGLSWYPFDTDNTNLLEQYAEFAMRQVKRGGRNAYKFFDKATFVEAENYIRSSRNIEMLISEGLIHYAFQPIVNAITGEIFGYEALMRPDPTNAITPHDVIVFATEQNKLNLIERITWFTALEDFSMQTDPRMGKKMFINSIPNQLLTDWEFGELEARYGILLSNIVLEIIENEQTDPDIIAKKKSLVERWGCLLALDDYGSGYANDNTLLALKPDVIKLDIELITGIETDSDRQTLVRNIIEYSHQRNIMVLAEGIETYAQMAVLISYGVDLMQGFYLAKPSFDVIDSIDPKIINEIINIRGGQMPPQQ